MTAYAPIGNVWPTAQNSLQHCPRGINDNGAKRKKEGSKVKRDWPYLQGTWQEDGSRKISETFRFLGESLVDVG